MADSDFERKVEKLARLEGKSPEQVKEELLSDLLEERLEKRDALTRTDSSVERARRGDIGAPDHEETPEEAAERWYEEEAMLPDGVHGLGGQTGGGIFGDGTIATASYDPGAMHRAERRVATLQQARTAQAQEVAALEQAKAGRALTAMAERMGLLPPAEPQAPAALEGRPSRRRRGGRRR